MNHCSSLSTFAIPVAVGLASAGSTYSLHAQELPTHMESLAEVVSRNPSEVVQLSVDFHAIQREPQIINMLDGSNMLLDAITFKFVGSGGGGVGAYGPYGPVDRMTIEEVFDEAELEHRLFFQLGVSEGNEIPDIPCPVADEMASTEDTHGKPGDPAVEIACGVRVVEMKISGSAVDALNFSEQFRDIAVFRKTPSDLEMEKLMKLMMERRCKASGGKNCEE